MNMCVIYYSMRIFATGRLSRLYVYNPSVGVQNLHIPCFSVDRLPGTRLISSILSSAELSPVNRGQLWRNWRFLATMSMLNWASFVEVHNRRDSLKRAYYSLPTYRLVAKRFVSRGTSKLGSSTIASRQEFGATYYHIVNQPDSLLLESCFVE